VSVEPVLRICPPPETMKPTRVGFMVSRSRVVVAPFVLVIAAAIVSACGGGAGDTARGRDDPRTSLIHRSTTTSAPSGSRDSEHLTIDCLGDENCPAITVEGDRPAVLPTGAPSPLRGLSDATIRRDPVTGVLWMAYSWPSVHVGAAGKRGTRVETHLARSADDGVTWSFAGVLWPADKSVDPETGTAGFTDHEVPNLLPVFDEEGKSLRWVGARLDLFVPEGGTLAKRPGSSFRIAVAVGPDPEALASTVPVMLGSAGTHSGWDVDIDLTDLDPSLGRCTLWNEPALHFDGSTLFLALRCLPVGGGGPDVVDSSIEVFATRPEGDASTWRWAYAGRLAGHSEAAELGADGLTQLELAEARDGTLLAIVTPDRWDVALREFVHVGLRVLEVDSLEDPSLARDEQGRLLIRAQVDASDLQPFGPGAGAYESTAELGLVMMRRVIGSGGLVASLHDTGIHP
jgi:hypothetical protein